MKFVDWTLPSPAQNLACDEILLDACEMTGEEFLRVWESPVHFAVLGYGNKASAEVDLETCAAQGIPVLRRCSGGGTVVQGPGCLSYAICLRATENGPLSTVTATNQLVMERNRNALRHLMKEEIAVQGCTDLAIRSEHGWIKFSGNSQRRRKESVLFHGTILYNFDLPLVAQILRFPTRQPSYRASRSHTEFITNIGASAKGIIAALRTEWQATNIVDSHPICEVEALASSRYSSPEWNRL